VVIASGSLIPYEIYEIIKLPRLGRCVFFVLNVATVIYLARRALIEHKERAVVRRTSRAL